MGGGEGCQAQVSCTVNFLNRLSCHTGSRSRLGTHDELSDHISTADMSEGEEREKSLLLKLLNQCRSGRSNICFFYFCAKCLICLKTSRETE